MGDKVTFASNGDTAEGYLAIPEGGSGPGVVVIQEWWGLVPHIETVCERLARNGFVALAPDIYRGAKTTEPDEAMRLLMGLAIDRAARDIAGAAAYLKGRDEVTSAGIGCMGFCMGGSLALWSATISEDIVATAGFYPAIPWEKVSPTWTNYAGKAALIHACEEDGGPEAPGIVTAKEAIEAAGGTVTVHGYPGTKHAFYNDSRPEVHDPEASALARERTLAHFREHLS